MKFLDLAAFNHFVRLLNSPYTIAFGLSLLIPTHEMAATTGMSAGSSKPYSSKPTFQTPVKKEEPPQQQQYKPLVKTEMPPMAKPFGMPGVVGLQNEKWVGTDYLGYLSNQIGIFVEILKAEAVPSISDTALISFIAALTLASGSMSVTNVLKIP